MRVADARGERLEPEWEGSAVSWDVRVLKLGQAEVPVPQVLFLTGIRPVVRAELLHGRRDAG